MHTYCEGGHLEYSLWPYIPTVKAGTYSTPYDHAYHGCTD